MAFSLEETIDFAITQRLAAVWTTLPARVLSYDDSTQVVSLQPIPAVYIDDDPQPMASLSNVRACFIGGGGGGIKFKLAAGDVGTVHFCARSIAVYQQTGNEGDPGEVRMHDLSDALFSPTNSGGATLPTETGDDLRIYEPTGAKVALGSKGAGRLAVARQTDAVSPTAAMLAYFAAVSAAIVTAGGPAVPAPASFGTITGGSAKVTAG